MLDMKTLNLPQRQAVESWRGPMMILAGAGTGKTRVMTFRIARMLEQGVPPGEIVALTFTNKAAREMRERLLGLVPGEAGKKVSVTTFHSFCLRQLRATPLKYGLRQGFKLLGSSDQLALVARSIEECGWSQIYQAEDIYAAISSCKNWMISPKDLRQGREPGAGLSSTVDWAAVADLFELYDKQLSFHQAIDFDDCIYKLVMLLQENHSERHKFHKRYRYFCVDEFQDTNFSQLELLRLMAEEHQNLCVVGDDDQSIYSWRGALVENLQSLERMFPSIELVKLEQNYRCSPNILELSNQLITHNLVRKSKTLWSDRPNAKPVKIAEFAEPETEARWIAKHMLALSGRGYRFADMAILYRANNQASKIELALREAHVPYLTVGGQSFFERKEVKDLLGYLRLLVNPSDRMAFWRVVNTPPRGIGLATQEKLAKLAEQSGVSPFEACKRVEVLQELSAAARSGLRNFTQVFEGQDVSALGSALDCRNLVVSLLRASGLKEQIKKEAKTASSKIARLKHLDSVPSWIEASAQRLIEEGKEAFDPYKMFDRLTLGEEDRQSGDSEEAGNRVTLMTIHASKGLEYSAVVVTGLEEGTLPHRNSLSEEASESALDEERRLFYVAMTRAKHELAISYALKRPMAGRKQLREKSRFLKEIQKDEGQIEWVSGAEKPPNQPQSREQKKQTMLAKLAFLRDL